VIEKLVRQPAQRIQITEWWEKELAQLPKKDKEVKGSLDDMQPSTANSDH